MSEHLQREPSVQENRPAIALRYAAAAILFYTAALWLGYTYVPSWYALPCAALPLLMALVLHNLKTIGVYRYAFSVPLNATATGLAASAYFRALALPLTGEELLWGAAMLLLLLLAAFLLATRFDTPRRQTVIMALSLAAFIVALIALIVLWCTHPREDTLYALLTFDLIFFGFYYLAFFVVVTDEENDPQKLISFWSFSLALSVALVAGIALLIAGGGDGCDCDCSDGCDCADCGCDLGSGTSKKKKK